MKLEEYIFKRKKEDGINECDLEKRSENTRICVNYIFEYFNNYLDTQVADERTLLHEQKIDKYRNLIGDYDPEIREWLVSIYSSYGKYMHRHLIGLINSDYFLLYDSDAEFRALSYEIYPKAAKRFNFLEGQSEMVFRFLKEVHRVKNLVSPFEAEFNISEDINEWIHATYRKHGVNIYNFCCEWVSYFSDHPEMWPKGHRLKSAYYSKEAKIRISDSMYWDYDYKQKSNLFGLDALYTKMPKKSFTRGKKQEFEAVLMYCWLHKVEANDEYWHEYSKSLF